MAPAASYELAGSPLAVGLHALVRVHGRQRRRHPAGFQRVRRIGARTHRHQAEFLAGFQDGSGNLFALGVRAPDLETRLAGHAMAQRADLAALDGHLGHVEELQLGQRRAVQLVDHILGLGALDLEAVELAGHCVAVRARRRTVVVVHLHVVATGLGVELHPVDRRGAAHDHEAVFAEVEQDGVADDMAAVRAGHELLGLVRHEALHRIDGETLDELQRVRAYDEQVHHVVGLIEQHRGVAPRGLLTAPVRKLRRHDRIHIRTDLRIAQMVDRVCQRPSARFQGCSCLFGPLWNVRLKNLKRGPVAGLVRGRESSAVRALRASPQACKTRRFCHVLTCRRQTLPGAKRADL